MSYVKISTPVPGLSAALAAVLSNFAVTDPVAPTLTSAGTRVRLETEDEVWVSCVLYDRAETLQVDLVTVAIALKNGVPWQKANGQHVAVVFWHGLFPDALAALTVSTARKALMMIALGEPQPQVPYSTPAEGGPATHDAIELGDTSDRSIRSAILAAQQMEDDLEDVMSTGGDVL